MKLRRLRIHNFRSIIDADIEVHDYTIGCARRKGSFSGEVPIRGATARAGLPWRRRIA